MSRANRKRPSETGRAFHDEYAESTALYKLLEMNTLQNPLFLGRTLRSHGLYFVYYLPESHIFLFFVFSYRAPHRRCKPLLEGKQGARAKIRELLTGSSTDRRLGGKVKELSLCINQISAPEPNNSQQPVYACSMAVYRETISAHGSMYSLLEAFTFSGALLQQEICQYTMFVSLFVPAI